MSQGFVFFEGSSSENTAPRITVRKGGQMVLTRGTVEMLGGDVTHVQLGFDPKTKRVGIRAAGEEAKGSYRLRSQGTNGLHLVAGKRFFAHYGIEIGKAQGFDAEKLEDSLVGFCLAEKSAEEVGGKETRGRRAKAA